MWIVNSRVLKVRAIALGQSANENHFKVPSCLSKLGEEFCYCEWTVQPQMHTQGNRIRLMGFRLSQETGADCLIGHSSVDTAGSGSGVSGRVTPHEMCAFLCICVHSCPVEGPGMEQRQGDGGQSREAPGITVKRGHRASPRGKCAWVIQMRFALNEHALRLTRWGGIDNLSASDSQGLAVYPCENYAGLWLAAPWAPGVNKWADIPLFPVTVVGSWPRSNELVRALRSKEAGESTYADFSAVANGEVLDCIRAQEEAGVDILSDGEQRRDNFYSFAVDKLNGMQLMKVSELLNYSSDRARMEEVLRALDVPAFAIKRPHRY